jgi:hypothetical protein
MPDPLTGIGLGLSGIGSILNLFGPDKEEEQWKRQLTERQRQEARSDAKRKAALSYLQQIPQFQQPDYQFKPEEFRDITQPIGQAYQAGQRGLQNVMGLQGQGRGGQMLEQTGRYGRQHTQDMMNVFSQLRRKDKQQQFANYLKGLEAQTSRQGLLANAAG